MVTVVFVHLIQMLPCSFTDTGGSAHYSDYGTNTALTQVSNVAVVGEYTGQCISESCLAIPYPSGADLKVYSGTLLSKQAWII